MTGALHERAHCAVQLPRCKGRESDRPGSAVPGLNARLRRAADRAATYRAGQRKPPAMFAVGGDGRKLLKALAPGRKRWPRRRTDRRRVRLHHRRRGLGRLRAGEPALGRSEEPRAAARGRRQRQLDLVPHPGRLPVRDRQSALRLDVQDRAGAGPQRPQPQLSARQGDRRLVRDQRHDLHARAGGRLRPLAPARPHRLGLGRRAAVLQEARGPFPRRERAPRGRRRMADRASARALGHARCVPRGGRAGRHQADRGLQHRRQRGLLLFPRQPEARPALVGGARLPQAGAAPAEPAAGNRLPGRGRRVRGQARGRRALAPERRRRKRAAAAR